MARDVSVNIIGRDRASQAFNQVARSAQASADSVSRSSRAMSSAMNIAKGVVVGTVAYKGFAAATALAKDSIFGFNSTLQQSQIAFTTMLGSGKKAEDFIARLQQFAKVTPFDFQGLVQNSQSLLGMGVAAKDILPTLKALGDSVASVGGSSAVLDNTISAFGQTMAKGTLDMGNMNQLLQGGIPNALKILAASYHVTTGEMVKMISSGKVQSSDALPRLIKGIEQGTSATAALGGMMDKQSHTFQGALSNIHDALQQSLAKAFRPFFDSVSKGAQSLANWLGSGSFTRFASGMTSAFSVVGRVVGGALRVVIAGVRDFVSGFSKGTDGPNSPQSRMAAIGAAAYAMWNQHIKPAVSAVIAFLPKLLEGFKNLWATVGPLVKEIGEKIGKALPVAFDAVRSAIKAVGDAIGPVTEWLRSHGTVVRSVLVAVGAAVVAFKAWTTAIKLWQVVTKAATAVQVAFNVVMDANPIMLVVVAIAALAAGLVYAYKHSESFRKVVDTAFHAVGTAAQWLWGKVLKPVFTFIGDHWKVMLDILLPGVGLIVTNWKKVEAAANFLWEKVLRPTFDFIGEHWRTLANGFSAVYNDVVRPVFKFLVDAALTTFGAIVDGAASAFGWVPGVGGKLKKARDAFHTFRKQVDDVLSAKIPPIPTPDTRSAEQALNDLKAIAEATKTALYFNSGGGPSAKARDIAGARAAGGPVLAGRKYLVGEHGPEIYTAGASGYVNNADASAKMLDRSGPTTVIEHQELHVHYPEPGAMGEALPTLMRASQRLIP